MEEERVTCIDRTLLFGISDEKNFVRRSSGGNRDGQVLREKRSVNRRERERSVWIT